MRFQLTRAHRLASFSATHLDTVAAYWGGFKIMIKTDNAVNFGAGDIEAFGNNRHSRIWHIAYVALNSMQKG